MRIGNNGLWEIKKELPIYLITPFFKMLFFFLITSQFAGGQWIIKWETIARR
jgi:hypothetical protein